MKADSKIARAYAFLWAKKWNDEMPKYRCQLILRFCWIAILFPFSFIGHLVTWFLNEDIGKLSRFGITLGYFTFAAMSRDFMLGRLNDKVNPIPITTNPFYVWPVTILGPILICFAFIGVICGCIFIGSIIEDQAQRRRMRRQNKEASKSLMEKYCKPINWE